LVNFKVGHKDGSYHWKDEQSGSAILRSPKTLSARLTCGRNLKLSIDSPDRPLVASCHAR